MELTDLRYFALVVAADSFVGAARRAHVSPAAISKAIKRLEDDLGVELFVRSTRSVSLTQAGKVVLTRAERVLREADGVRKDLEAVSGDVVGEVRIAAMEVFSTELLPRVLGALLGKHPAVRPLSFEMPPEQIERCVSDGRCDVGFTIGGGRRRELETHALGTSPGVLVCGRGHPLYGGRTVSLRDLGKHPFVVPRFLGREDEPPIDQFPESRLPRVAGATIELMRMGIELCATGRFLGYFPEVSVRGSLESGRLRALGGLGLRDEPPFELLALTRRSREPSRAVTALIALVREHVHAALKAPSRPRARA